VHTLQCTLLLRSIRFVFVLHPLPALAPRAHWRCARLLGWRPIHSPLRRVHRHPEPPGILCCAQRRTSARWRNWWTRLLRRGGRRHPLAKTSLTPAMCGACWGRCWPAARCE
jgi:hypothetical protein